MPPKVKICGTTNLDDAVLAADLGAWALGLIFYERSRRHCGIEEAERIAAALRRRVQLCGVFVDAPLGRVADVADRVGLSMVQLHGGEGPAYCAEVARRTGARVVKAVTVRSRADLQAVASFHTDLHLLDSRPAGPRARPGAPFDWSLAAAHRGPIPLILSGGLTPENVAAAVAVTAPYAVDVASGVEVAPGRKDPARLEAFLAAVAPAGPAGEAAPGEPTTGPAAAAAAL